jgi:hypothetical protein
MNSETRDTKESKDHKAQNRSLQKDHSLKTSSRNLRDGSDPKETASDIHTSPGVFDLNRPLAAGVVLPTALWNSSTEDFRPGETPLAPTHLNEDSAALREGRPESLRTVLGNTGGINPLAKGFDPINLTVDATRQPVNPVLPVSPVPGLANPLNSPLLQTPESALEKRLAPAESRALDLRIEALGSSSLSPNISTPAVEAAPKPYTPGPTQFPTRRF